MKKLIGKPKNINKEILGKITFKRNHVFSKQDLICVVKDTQDLPKGYIAVLLNVSITDTKQSAVTEIQGLSELNEGDVVIVNPDGLINILYEIKSLHNAIIATEWCNHRCIMCPQSPILQEKDKTDLISNCFHSTIKTQGK